MFYGVIGIQTSMLQCLTEALKEGVTELIATKDSEYSFILAPLTLQLMKEDPFENIIAFIEELRYV